MKIMKTSSTVSPPTAQLSLFNVAEVIRPAYQVGDRVKIRKKPIAASYLKKGDIVEIAAIHPLDGSIKFWNERSERWEFIHPDEISSILKSVSLDDSVTPVEVAVTESKPDPGSDSVTPVEVAVTESKYPHSEIETCPLVDADTESKYPHSENDSVSKGEAQIADTEYTVPPADKYDSVSKGEAQIADTEYTVPPADKYDSVSKAISTYRPRGTARSGEYFRFSYRDGSRMRHIHIRGGNTDSPIAQAKVREVRSLLAAGIAPAEIAAMLKLQPKSRKVTSTLKVYNQDSNVESRQVLNRPIVPDIDGYRISHLDYGKK